MSAFIVSKAHIDALVYMASATKLRYWNGERSVSIREEGLESMIGALLWSENQQSVAARYPNDQDGEWPGPGGLTLTDIKGYTFTRIAPHRFLSAVETLKALASYEYQSCEHDGWETSEAKVIVEALRHHMICRLPGYDEAAWEID